MKIQNTVVEPGRCAARFAALCAALCTAGAAHAVQVSGGGIGAVIGAEPAPAVVITQQPLRATPAPGAALSVAQTRPWGGMKLDTNPFATAQVKR